MAKTENLGIFDRYIPETFDDVLQQDRELDLASSLKRAEKAVAAAAETYASRSERNDVGWAHDARRLRDLLKFLRDDLGLVQTPEIEAAVGRKRYERSKRRLLGARFTGPIAEKLRSQYAAMGDRLPEVEILRALGRTTLEQLLASTFEIAALTIATEISLRGHERAARVGHKSLEGARRGHAETYGTAQQRDREREKFQAAYDEAKKANPTASRESIAKNLARRFKVSAKTIKRYTRK